MLRGLTLHGFYRLGLIKQVQRGTIITHSSHGGSNTLTINPVVMQNTIVLHNGALSDSGELGAIHTRVALTSATQVTATQGFGETSISSTTTSVEVIEFYPGVLRVQRGTITSVSPGNTDLTIAAIVMGKAYLNRLGHTVNPGGAVAWSATFGTNNWTQHVTLTTATNVRQTFSASGGYNQSASFEAVEILMHGLDG